MVVGGDDEGVVVVVVVTLTGCTFWRLRTHRVPGVRMLFKHQEESVPEAVAGIGGQVQAAELALLGLADAQAAELELQAMEQVFTFGACAAGGGCGGGRGRVQWVQEGARGRARTCSAHCRAIVAFAHAWKSCRLKFADETRCFAKSMLEAA